jgi:hypothetical protein
MEKAEEIAKLREALAENKNLLGEVKKAQIEASEL